MMTTTKLKTTTMRKADCESELKFLVIGKTEQRHGSCYVSSGVVKAWTARVEHCCSFDGFLPNKDGSVTGITSTKEDGVFHGKVFQKKKKSQRKLWTLVLYQFFKAKIFAFESRFTFHNLFELCCV